MTKQKLLKEREIALEKLKSWAENPNHSIEEKISLELRIIMDETSIADLKKIMPIIVNKEIFAGLEYVRLSGLTNMLDYNHVMRIAFEKDYFHTVEWLIDNKELYVKAIFKGIEELEE